MRGLRGSLIAFAWIIFFGNLFGSTLSILQTDIEAYDRLSTFIFQEISYFLIVLPTPALMIWAALNLGSSAFSHNLVSFILKFSLCAALAGTIVLIAQTLSSYKLIPPQLNSFGLKDILRSINYYIYTIGEVLLITFAIKQLSQSKSNQPLNSNSTSGIKTNPFKKIRSLGDKTPVINRDNNG